MTEPSKIGEGSRSRVKVHLLNDYPTEVINSTKLPLGRQVVLNFFFNLLEDSDQTKHSNPHSFELLSLFRKHMWYLTDRLIPLSLFDSSGNRDGNGTRVVEK